MKWPKAFFVATKFRNLSFWKNDLYSLRPNLFSCLGRQSFRSHSITVVLYVWLPVRLSAKQFFPCFLLMLLLLFGFSLSDFCCCCCCFVSPKKKRKSNARSQGPCRFLSNSAAMQFPAVWPCLARLSVCARITAPCWQRQMQWTHARTETRRTCIETTFERADKQDKRTRKFRQVETEKKRNKKCQTQRDLAESLINEFNYICD